MNQATDSSDSSYPAVLAAMNEMAELRSQLEALAAENSAIIELLLASAKLAGADEDPLVANYTLEAAHRLGLVNDALEKLAQPPTE